MNDKSDELIPLAKVAKFLPPALRSVHASTAARWALRGVGNPKVKIETVKVGGRRYVTQAAVDRFVATLSASGGIDSLAVGSTLRQKQIQEAEDQLDKAGFCPA